MALWLVFKWLSSYLFVYWLLFVFTAEKYYLEFQSKLKDWIKRYLIETWHRLFQGCFKSYRIAFGVALWLDFGQLSCYLFVYRRLFRVTISKCHMEFDTKLEDGIKIHLIQTYHRLSQEYFKSYRIAYRVALWLDFEQLSSYLFVYWLLFVFTAEKYYLEFQSKLKDWIKRYLIETWHRLFQGCFKSYRIAFRVALWLDFEQLSIYLFVYRRLFRAAISKCYMEFDTKLADWMKRYLIQTYQRLSQEYFKSYRIALRVALWLDVEQLSSYLFVYRRIFGVAVWKCYMEFDIKLEDWIKRYLIETWHGSFQEYFKSYWIAFRVALWLDFEQLSSYLFVYWLLFGFTAEKYHLDFDSKLKDWTNGYLIENWERLSQEYIK